jgi:SAM-dependent methyltransferase
MSFSAEWLALREPADHAARSAPLTAELVGALSPVRPLRLLDLAAGTGSNLRYLVDHLPDGQRWLLVDHDPALLAQALLRMPRSERIEHVDTREQDLSDPQTIASGIFDGRLLVTASALLDLVSEEWLRALAARCREAGAAVLFTLSYDGRLRCTPEDPRDAMIRELVNRHQRGDKGFGPALGPLASRVAAGCFAELGYEVRRATSDWILAPDQSALQHALIGGWAQAAAAIAPERAQDIDAWRAERLAHVDARRSHVVVGHEDLGAWSPVEERP